MTLTAKQIGRAMWKADGEPDGGGLGEANRGTYEREAKRVLAMIRALGFTVTAKAPKAE